MLLKINDVQASYRIMWLDFATPAVSNAKKLYKLTKLPFSTFREQIKPHYTRGKYSNLMRTLQTAKADLCVVSSDFYFLGLYFNGDRIHKTQLLQVR